MPSSIKVYEAVIAASVNSCIVIVLDTVFKHIFLSGAFDLDFALQQLCHDFTSSSIKVCFSEAVITVSVKPYIVIVLDILFKRLL